MPTMRLPPSALRAPLAARPLAPRSFATSAARAAGKESTLHNEGRPDEAEALKQQQLREQKQGQGKWHEGLASDSESAVKADRGDQKDANKSIGEMQRDTAQAAQEEKKKP
ncbi:hypothetical protein WHR41_03799 [Cladosporium halotolerans]|uniref:Mitochondrial carrier protein pet8 n=1 Tax=Cladosporium halotolerans TaxID=1052096 RepID=A0AB34KRD9_9PEZI